MARIKPDSYIVADLDQAEGTLAEIAALEREITSIKTAMQETIDNAKVLAARQAAPLMERRKKLAEALGTYAKLNQKELFVETKSIDLGCGVIGFRASTRIAQMRGVTAEMTLGKLHEYNFLDAIRIKEEVNKEVCISWPKERLELVGLERQLLNTFYIEISEDKLPQEATAMP